MVISLLVLLYFFYNIVGMWHVVLIYIFCHVHVVLQFGLCLLSFVWRQHLHCIKSSLPYFLAFHVNGSNMQITLPWRVCYCIGGLTICRLPEIKFPCVKVQPTVVSIVFGLIAVAITVTWAVVRHEK